MAVSMRLRRPWLWMPERTCWWPEQRFLMRAEPSLQQWTGCERASKKERRRDVSNGNLVLEAVPVPGGHLENVWVNHHGRKRRRAMSESHSDALVFFGA